MAYTAGNRSQFFPHAREWTCVATPRSAQRRVFPARAGVDRRRWVACLWIARFSRTRGSGPGARRSGNVVSGFFPHAREWTERETHTEREKKVFPARAGVDRMIPSMTLSGWGFSRTRGSGPSPPAPRMAGNKFFPHAREWTLPVLLHEIAVSVFPARAGVDRRQL